MFSGIISNIGEVISLNNNGSSISLYIKPRQNFIKKLSLGDSVAINGVCLTIKDFSGEAMLFDVSSETLSLTNLGLLKVASLVNMELALTMSDFLSGGLVSGHIDTLAEVFEIKKQENFSKIGITFNPNFADYIVKKGSITLDGVNLTINEVEGDKFWLMIVPHTLENTIIEYWELGQKINMEVDLIARYCLGKR